MKQELLLHKKAYFWLVLGLLSFVVLFMAAWPNHGVQRAIAVLTGLFYFLWGIMTHVHTAYLTKRVLYEYASVAVLATVLLLLITF